MKTLFAGGPLRRILARWLGVVLGLLLVPWPAHAAGGLDVRIDELNTAQFPGVELRLAVTGGDGVAIPGLAAGDFLLAEDGRPITPASITYEKGDRPLSLVLAIDTSGSMAGKGLQAAQAAARALIEGLPASTQVAIVPFSTTATVATDFTADRARLAALLDGLKAAGDTALYDAVFDAADLCARTAPGRQLVVTLTDGEDTSSAVTLADAADRAGRAHTRVYTVGFGVSVDPATLRRLAKLTGGLYYAAPTANDLVVAFNAIAEAYSYEYLIRFQSGLPLANQEHALEVKVQHQGLSGEASQPFTSLPAGAAVQFISPQPGSALRGPVAVEVHGLGRQEIESLELQLDGQTLTTAQGATLTYTWDPSEAARGSHTLKAVAREAGGATGEGTLAVEVAAPVEVRLVTPLEGQELAGQVPIKAEVLTGWEVASVEFLLDGQPIRTLNAPPYELDWDATQVSAGRHQLTVRATTSRGQSAEKAIAVTVVVPVGVRFERLPGQVGSRIQVSALVSATAGIAKVEYYVDDRLVGSATAPPYRVTLDPRALNLVPGEHQLVAKAYDLAGYTGTARASITVLFGPGNFLPWLGAGVLLAGLIIAGSFVLRARRARQVEALTAAVAAAEAGVPAQGAVLEVASGPGTGLVYPLLPGVTRLGRSASRNDIKVDGLTASREHARVKQVGQRFVVEDITDKNPTIVNGREIAGSQELVSGDRIEIGDMVFIFRQGGK